MSFNHTTHGITYKCDECGDSIDTEQEDFFDAKDMIKREGWKITKDGEEWRHVCPACS